MDCNSAGVANEHKVAGLEVIQQESVLVLALELFDRGEACLEDVVVDGGKVALAQLELAGADCEEVGGQKRLGEVGDEKRRESDVEGENWLNPVHHVERREASQLAGGCSVGPEDVRGEGWPLGVVAFAGLDKGIANCPVLSLDVL